MKEMFPSLVIFPNLLTPRDAGSDAAACPSMHWAEGKETVWGTSGCDPAPLTNEASCCPEEIFSFPPHGIVRQRAPLCLHGHKKRGRIHFSESYRKVHQVAPKLNIDTFQMMANGGSGSSSANIMSNAAHWGEGHCERSVTLVYFSL